MSVNTESITKHCPLINSVCKEDGCTFWADDYCAIYLYLAESLGIVSRLPVGEGGQDYEEIIQQLENVTAEELADEYIQLYEEQEQQSTYPIRYEVRDFFKFEKGIDMYSVPDELGMKTLQVETIARFKLNEKRLAEILEKTQQERAIIPDLADKLDKWAEAYGFKSVRLKDVHTFLLEQGVELTDTNLRFLQSKVNTVLKAKR